MRNVLDKFVEKIKTYFVFSNFFFFENLAFYKIMSKNVVEPEARNGVAIWRIRVECWISKATCTHAHVHAHAPGHAHTHTDK